MLKLQAVFPKDINENTYEAYYESLKDWKIKYIEQGGVWFTRNARFFPLPIDFQTYLFEQTGGFESISSTMKEETPKLTQDSVVTDITDKIGRPQADPKASDLARKAAIDAYRNKGKD